MSTPPLSFLQYREEPLFRIYQQAERLCHEDPAAACAKLRGYAEQVVVRLCELAGLPLPRNLNSGLDTLRSRKLLGVDILGRLDELRMLGNRSAHPSRGDDPPHISVAIRALSLAHAVGEWFAVTHHGVADTDLIRFTPPDPALSLQIYRDAIVMDDAEAQHQVALLLLHDADAQRDKQLLETGVVLLFVYDKPVEWLRKAQFDVPSARARLGKLMWQGLLSPDFPEEPLHLLESAAADGDPDAHNELGHAYLEGTHDRPIDYAVAREHLEAAAAHEHLEALTALVAIYANGLGTPRDPRQAIQFARRGAEGGYPIAQYNLAVLIGLGEAGVDDHEGEAVKWLKKAAEGGYPEAMYELWSAYRDGNGVEADRAMALKWRGAALDRLEPRACFDMGLAYETGDGVEQDALKALRMYGHIVGHPPPQLPNLLAKAKAKLREMVLRLRRELWTQPSTFPPQQANDRMLIEFGTDDTGDPIPGFTKKLVEELLAEKGMTPASMIAALEKVNPSAAERMRLMRQQKPRPPTGPIPPLPAHVTKRWTAGPTDPCPCGSGLKRKKCHRE